MKFYTFTFTEDEYIHLLDMVRVGRFELAERDGALEPDGFNPQIADAVVLKVERG